MNKPNKSKPGQVINNKYLISKLPPKFVPPAQRTHRGTLPAVAYVRPN